MTDCAWSPDCPQETCGDSVFCYFHGKRAQGLSKGICQGRSFAEPSAQAKALVEALNKKAANE